MNILAKNWVVSLLLTTSLFFSAAIGFWVFTRISFGNYDFYYSTVKSLKTPIQYATDLSRREILILVPFATLVVLFGIKPNILIDFIENALIHGVVDINNKYQTTLIHQMMGIWTDIPTNIKYK